MAKEDLLTKQINQLGFVLRKMFEKLTGSSGEDELSEAVSQVNVQLFEELGFDLDMLKEIELIDLLSFLSEKESLTNENLELLADVLYKADKIAFKEKVLEIYAHIDKESATFSIERNAKIQSIKKA